MNKYKYYLFDLDGTISESALGIRESLENAIKSMGKPLPNLDNDELTTVGTMISIEHTSPTPLGAEVTATAVLKSVDGRMFNFEVFAEDKKGEIARGTHTRVSVKSEKFQMKADSKFDE